jgi:hypothetical protein
MTETSYFSCDEQLSCKAGLGETVDGGNSLLANEVGGLVRMSRNKPQATT